MKPSKISVSVRLANESTRVEMKIAKDTFKVDKIYDFEVFGWLSEQFVAIDKKDWERACLTWKAEEEKWNLTVIDEKGSNLIVSAPNGDTAYMSKKEYESYNLKNKNMNMEFIEMLRKKYPNVEIDLMIEIWKSEIEEIKNGISPFASPEVKDLRVPLDSGLNGNIIAKVISKYVKTLNKK